jgi:2-hydroxychromene-2-carboxylate isomerase
VTQVNFWFDVGCRWTWLTAEWVRQVAPLRDVHVRWRVYSLTLRKLGDARPEPGRSFTLGAARVLEAVWADHGDPAIGPLYEHIGRAIHVPQATRDRSLLERALSACGLDPAYAGAADDERWDAEVHWSMAEADQLAGADVAVPIVAVGPAPARAYGGPVLSRRLTDEAALRVWDAFVTLAAEPAFFELKRGRSERPTL